MAIISCPQCSKKISDKSQSCQHCQLDLTQMTSERLHSLSVRKKTERLQGYMNQSMFALLIFLASFCVLYFWELEPATPAMYACQAAIGASFVWYIAARAMIILLKRKK